MLKLGLKVGVATLALLMAALPVMACVRPGAVMTAAERDCCKRMAERCGHSSMAKSHGCCQPQESPSNFQAVKASSVHLDHSLIELHAAQAVALQVVPAGQMMFTTGMPSLTHGPPGLLGSVTTILRI